MISLYVMMSLNQRELTRKFKTFHKIQMQQVKIILYTSIYSR